MATFRLVAPLVLLLLLGWRPAAADDANRNFLPFGERAAFLGNAGITSDLGEAVYYNPANLARIRDPNLSVTGNLYARFELEADPLLVIEGVEQPFRASGFISNPSSLVSTYRIGSWALATAVLLPEAVELHNRVSFDSPNLHVTILEDNADESLWLGGSVAREISPGLAVGASVFVTRESSTQLAFTRVEVGTDPPVASEFTSNVELTVYNLSAIAGIFWQAHPKVGLGFRAAAPPIKLAGNADVYQASLVPGDEELTFEQDFDDVTVSRPFPWDFGIGASFRPTAELELVADVSLQMPATLTTFDEPDIPEIGTTVQKVELAPRVGIGADWRVRPSLSLRLGLLYNQSAYPDPDDASDAFKGDYYGTTGGIAWLSGRTQTALGGFYIYSPIELLVDGSDPLEESDAHLRLFGVLLTVSYRL